MSVIEAIILGAVQGLTEFLPISSSGHLVLIQKFFGYTQDLVEFNIILLLELIYESVALLTELKRLSPAKLEINKISSSFSNFFLKRFRALSIDSFSFTFTIIILFNLCLGVANLGKL